MEVVPSFVYVLSSIKLGKQFLKSIYVNSNSNFNNPTKKDFNNGGIWVKEMLVMMLVTPRSGMNGTIWLVH